ncbi:MAG: MraY family glycosyltransferase [Candidatus Promineifilaceae bacterium]|nr:MraY family glycosyltransferase [Candidatus Promineifilaceae bacterium]
MRYLLVFLAAAAVAALLTPAARQLSLHWDVTAKPGGRRRHHGLIPKLGGVPIFIAFMVGAAVAWIWISPYMPGTNPDDARLLRGVLWGSVVIFIGGLIDDYRELPPWALFAFQFLALGVAMGHQIFIQRFNLPLLNQQVALDWQGNLLAAGLVFMMTAIWIVGIVNTVNFLDGLDGLASGVGAIAALLFAWHGLNLGQTTIAAFPLALAGALVGFLLYNFAPARIFLGSGGAYFLGFALATLAILSPAKIATALLVLAVPMLDVAWQIVARLHRGQSPFRGDRGHLHFRLSDFGLPTRHIVVGYYLVAIVFGLVAILAPNRDTKLVMLLVLTALVAGTMFWLSQRAGRM